MHIIGETINITSMKTNGQATMMRKTHFLAFQEHVTDKQESQRIKGAMAKIGIRMLAGPADPEHAKKSGEVGMLSHSPLRPIAMKAITDDFEDAMKSGRLAAYILGIANATILVMVIYGLSGGHQNEEATARTNDLFIMARQEMSLQAFGLQMLMGDINGEAEDFPCLQEMVLEEGWTDTPANLSCLE